MHASRIEHFTETSVVAAKIINCKAAGQEVTGNPTPGGDKLHRTSSTGK